MQAPEDDIDFNKKSAVYENRTYQQFEKLIRIYKYWDLTEVFLLFTFLIGLKLLLPYLINFLLFFQEEIRSLLFMPFGFNEFGHALFIVALMISSYQVYKSIDHRKENQKLGLRFYFFQSLKVIIYIFLNFNLLFIFAFIGLLRIAVIIYYSKTKSFK